VESAGRDRPEVQAVRAAGISALGEKRRRPGRLWLKDICTRERRGKDNVTGDATGKFGGRNMRRQRGRGEMGRCAKGTWLTIAATLLV
jgi:hypothetical protein